MKFDNLFSQHSDQGQTMPLPGKNRESQNFITYLPGEIGSNSKSA